MSYEAKVNYRSKSLTLAPVFFFKWLWVQGAENIQLLSALVPQLCKDRLLKSFCGNLLMKLSIVGKDSFSPTAVHIKIYKKNENTELSFFFILPNKSAQPFWRCHKI